MRVAINGAGIAGPTLAYWLRAFGHEPVLFESAPELRTGGYVIDFWGLGYEVAEKMGLAPSLLAQGYAMERLRMLDARGREVAGIDVTPLREQADGRFITIARGDLASLIFRACDDIPSHFGVSVVGLEQDAHGVDVRLSDGSEDRFDLVVGADGLHSQLRELAFGPERDFERPLGCHVAAFRIHGYPRRDELSYVLHTVPRRQVARISLRGDETLVLLVFGSERMDGEPAADARKATLRRVFGDMRWEVPEILDRMDEVDDVYFDRVSQIRLERWTKGRVALLGDAAACVSLLAGEGTGLAMIEAHVLAGELHRAKGDHVRAFQRYEALLQPFLRDKQRTALGFLGFFVPRSRLSLALRDWAVKLVANPMLMRLVVGRALRDDLEVPEYAALRA